MKSKNLKHIELFAGCGGMSLGLKSAGFDLYMANEISPMAGETFAFNLLGEDLRLLSDEKEKSKRVLWINSKFPAHCLKERLRENPFEIGADNVSDLQFDTDLKGKLLIGNINQLLDFLNQNPKISEVLKQKNIDVLSGGPPCQGFSLAGKRIKDDHKNLLPLSFAKFAELIQPKIVLLENVKGITSPFKTDDGVKHYTWFEVAKAFSLIGYIPICMLVNSKYFGIPQNRPRFLLLAFRKDIFKQISRKFYNSELKNSILTKSYKFFEKVQSSGHHIDKISRLELEIYKIENNPNLFDGKLFPNITTNEFNYLNAFSAIGDIVSTKQKYKITEIQSEYSDKLSSLFKTNNKLNHTELENHEVRNHKFNVKARFRLYQVLNTLTGVRNDTIKVIAGKFVDEKVLLEIFNSLKGEKLLVRSAKGTKFETIEDFNQFKAYLKNIVSKKHSQRAIKIHEPVPAQMTIPDDLCHYSPDELRTLTVREMARLQSFPDWFIFRSKVTTGGSQRSFEVPQYTQVGNAVPPILAYELGKAIRNILQSLE